MKLYLFGDGKGNWYSGRTPTGRIRTTTDYSEATLFAEGASEELADCLGLGYSLYSVEISEPKLEREGTGEIASSTTSSDFKSWEVHPMDLFNQ